MRQGIPLKYQMWETGAASSMEPMRGLRPVVIGMIGAAALLLMFPQDAGDASFIDFWSWILFGGVLAGSYFKLNPILLIVLSAAAGIAIYL